jgi:hypothetical protein
MSTFCTFETEYRLTSIDQSFWRLSLRCARCKSRKCGLIRIRISALPVRGSEARSSGQFTHPRLGKLTVGLPARGRPLRPQPRSSLVKRTRQRRGRFGSLWEKALSLSAVIASSRVPRRRLTMIPVPIAQIRTADRTPESPRDYFVRWYQLALAQDQPRGETLVV